MRLFASSPWRAIPELDGLGNDDGARMLRRAYMRAPGIWKVLPPIAMVLGGVASFVGQDLIAHHITRTWIRAIEPWDVIVYMCLPIATASLVYVATRRVSEVVLLRREMTGPVCPKCKSSLTGLRVESRGTEPDPAQNRVRCPECGRNWRMLDIGLTPRDLMPQDWSIAGAGTRLSRAMSHASDDEPA